MHMRGEKREEEDKGKLDGEKENEGKQATCA